MPIEGWAHLSAWLSTRALQLGLTRSTRDTPGPRALPARPAYVDSAAAPYACSCWRQTCASAFTCLLLLLLCSCAQFIWWRSSLNSPKWTMLSPSCSWNLSRYYYYGGKTWENIQEAQDSFYLWHIGGAWLSVTPHCQPSMLIMFSLLFSCRWRRWGDILPLGCALGCLHSMKDSSWSSGWGGGHHLVLVAFRAWLVHC